MKKLITTVQITLQEAAEISSLLSRYAAEHRISGEIEEAHRAVEIIRLFDRLCGGNCRYPVIESLDLKKMEKTLYYRTRRCVMVRNTSKKTIRSPKSDTLTPEEVRASAKQICRNKKTSMAFLNRIGITFDKQGNAKVRPI